MPLLCASVYGWRPRLAPAVGRRRFDRDFLLAMVLGPPALALAASLLTGMRMIALWGSPMWTFLGLLLWILFEPSCSTADLWRLMRRSAVCAVVMLVAFATAKVFHGELAGRVTRVQFPGRQLAVELGRRWAAVTDKPLRIVGGDWLLAGVAAFYHPQRPQVFPDMRAESAPWTGDDELRRTGGILVWSGTGPLPDKWQARFPGAVPGPPLEFAVRGVFRDLKARCGVAVIPPAPDGGPAGR